MALVVTVVRVVAVAMAVGAVMAHERSPVAASRALVMVDPVDRVVLEALEGMDKLETVVHPMRHSVRAERSKPSKPCSLRVTRVSPARALDDQVKRASQAPRQAVSPETVRLRGSTPRLSSSLS